MEGRTRVLSAANGPIDARVCFVAEAPGRLGGERTKVPLFADQSGRNFGRLLEAAGLDRGTVFITNAVLCNPQDHRGRNAPPSTGEIRTCSSFLRATLDLLQPAVVVTLGAVALRALALIEPHSLSLATDCGQVVGWSGRWLVPLYHPSPRAQLSRSFEEQVGDFRRLGAVLRGETGDRRAASVVPAGSGVEAALQPTGLVRDLLPEVDVHANGEP
jgi:uracil-DNA glycosylase family 4